MNSIESRIVQLSNAKQLKHIRIGMTPARVLDREILEWSPRCGTYGMGSPGFVGFRLSEKQSRRWYPEEWLILRLWGAGVWLRVFRGTEKSFWLEADPDQYTENRPLYSNFDGAQWDNFAPLIVGKTITRYQISQRSFMFEIGSISLLLTDNPEIRTGNKPRLLGPKDDLKNAWIFAPWPCVEVMTA